MSPRMVAVNHSGDFSGGEAVMMRMLAAARARGWEAVVACPAGMLSERARQEGMKHVELPELVLPAGLRPWTGARLSARHAAAAWRLRRASAGADLFVASGMRLLPTFRLARLSAPVVWLAQSVVDKPKWRAVVRACGPAVDLVVAVSDAVAASVHLPGVPLRVVRNGTPWPVAPAPGAVPDRPVVGCTAQLTPWKGQDVLLEAVSRLAPSVWVELLGSTPAKDGPYAQRLRRRAAEADLAGRVRFLGHSDDPLAEMRRWSVAVTASVDPEAGPLALLEAMSIGLPVVATDHGGSPEVIGGAGLLVPPRDPAAMASAIERLLGDPDLYRRCALAGPAQIARGLTLAGQTDALVDALEGAAGRFGTLGRGYQGERALREDPRG